MGALAAARHELVVALQGAEGVPRVYEVMPQTFRGPCVIFAPGDPWIEPVGPRGVGVVTYKVRVIAGAGNNVGAMNSLVDLVEATWDAIHAAPTWIPGTVEPITFVLDSGTSYTAADITVSNTIRTISD